MFSQGLGLGSISTVEINVQDWVRRVDFGEVLLHTLIEGQIPFEGSPRTSPFVIYFEGKQDLPLTIVKPFLRISFSWFIHRVTCCLYKASQHNIKLKKTWQQSTTSKSNLKANPIDWVIVLAKHKRFLSCWKKPCPQVLQFAKIKNELLTCSNWALVLDTWVREVKQPTKSRDLSGTCSSGLQSWILGYWFMTVMLSLPTVAIALLLKGGLLWYESYDWPCSSSCEPSTLLSWTSIRKQFLPLFLASTEHLFLIDLRSSLWSLDEPGRLVLILIARWHERIDIEKCC